MAVPDCWAEPLTFEPGVSDFVAATRFRSGPVSAGTSIAVEGGQVLEAGLAAGCSGLPELITQEEIAALEV